MSKKSKKDIIWPIKLSSLRKDYKTEVKITLTYKNN